MIAMMHALSSNHSVVIRVALRRIVKTEAPTILLINGNRPVVQPIGLLAIGPAYSPSYVRLHCLVSGLPH